VEAQIDAAHRRLSVPEIGGQQGKRRAKKS
jgi:hypothetical protein